MGAELVEPVAVRPSARARRGRRGIVATCLVLSIAWVCGALVGCMNISTPVDHLLNIGWLGHSTALEAEPGRRLVVLQHGLGRSSASLSRLERALEDHGYEVLNTSYKSYGETVEDASARLQRSLERHPFLQSEEEFEIAFVGHSMGGLVIRHYLGREGAPPRTRKPWACVFLGTPQRGARMAGELGDRWYFRLALGRASALQLRPGSGLFDELADPTDLAGCKVGVILGRTGREGGRSRLAPGDDDGRVGVEEARLPGAEHLELEVGHTALTTRRDVLSSVLRFLGQGTF